MPIKPKFSAFVILLSLFIAAFTGLSAENTGNGSKDNSEAIPGENLSISLMTIGQGDPVYLWYGHSAIIVEDRETGRNLLFDYGVFAFTQDNFYSNFARGRLIYGIIATPEQYRTAYALQEERNVYKISLDIPPGKRIEVLQFLQDNVKPGNNTYLYHHYKDNCATRIRDIIDMAVDGQLKEWSSSIESSMTYREHINRYAGNHFLMNWLLNFLQSGRIDVPMTLWDEMFLPDRMQAALLDFKYRDSSGNLVPIVSDMDTIAEFRSRPDIPDPDSPVVAHWDIYAAAGVLMGLLVMVSRLLWIKRQKAAWRILYGSITAFIGILPGLLGTGLLLMMFFTDHDVTFANENVAFASPILLAAGIIGILIAVGKVRLLRSQLLLFRIQCSLAFLLLLLKLFPTLGFIQENIRTTVFMIPVLIFCSLPFRRSVRE